MGFNSAFKGILNGGHYRILGYLFNNHIMI